MVEPPEGGVALEKQNTPAYRFVSVAHWLSAFHICVSIYCAKYPHEVGPLMKYAHTIQNLARRSCDLAVFIYDQTFRRWRETAWVHLGRNESWRFGALKSDSTHHFFRNACTRSGSLRFSQLSGC
jgi:hypothetical protein